MIRKKFRIALIVAAAAVLATHGNAAVVDLGSSGSGFLNGGFFSVSSQHPTGTGVFDPFLSIQNNPWEQGYNSGSGNFDTKREPQWNHEIRFSDLRSTTINGKDYFGFVVDVNEPNGSSRSTISLDALRIWTSATVRSSTGVDVNGFFNGSLGNLRYDLGAGNVVLYNDKHSGSGTADISIFIPVSNFAGVELNDYVYMYQRWGNTNGSQGGFEETRIAAGVAPIPEMNTLFPIVGLTVAITATHVLRRRKKARTLS